MKFLKRCSKSLKIHQGGQDLRKAWYSVQSFPLKPLPIWKQRWEAREKVVTKGLKRMSSSFKSLKWLGKSKIHGYQSRHNLRGQGHGEDGSKLYIYLLHFPFSNIQISNQGLRSWEAKDKIQTKIPKSKAGFIVVSQWWWDKNWSSGLTKNKRIW